MAKIQDVKEIPLEDLFLGKGQVRVSDTGRDIDELAESIARVGLLEPIVVCPASPAGKYEILTGQRRFLAHVQLRRPTILAAVLDERVDDTTAKVISLTENLVRRDLNRRDLITACTALYKKFGTITDVVVETGLPQRLVAQYVKYDRLVPELKELVDSGVVDVRAALRAQDAASVSGELVATEAVKLAKEMSAMSGAQQDRIIKVRRDDPDRDVDDVIEAAKSGEKITQIVVTLSATINQSLKRLASDEETTSDDAARALIEDGLLAKGYLGEIE